MKHIKLFEQFVNESKIGTIYKAAKKGSYPVTLVVIEKGKVIKQELVGTPEIVPAAFNILQEEYPKAIIHIEDRTGKRLFTESVVTEAKDDFMARYGSANINLKKGYKHHTEEELYDLYDKLGDLVKTFRVKDVTLVFESVVTEAKFVKDFNRDVLNAKTKEEVLELYPNAEFFIGKSDHFFGELDSNLFFKAYYTKAQKEFKIKSVYSEKGSNYVYLYNESVVNEAVEPQIQKIAELTGVSIDKVENYVSSKVLNITKLLKYIKDEKQVAIRDFEKAVKGDKKQDAYFIKMFNESVNEGDKMDESMITEKREDVGKYNTVKKVIKELGRRPSEQELATFITNNYYDVTEVERGEDDPSTNDKIADLVAFYKFDIDDWNIAWFDAQNESVNEGDKNGMLYYEVAKMKYLLTNEQFINEAKDKLISGSIDEAFIGPFFFSNSTSDEDLKKMYDDALSGYANWSKGFEYPKADYKKAYQEIEKLLKKKGIKVD